MFRTVGIHTVPAVEIGICQDPCARGEFKSAVAPQKKRGTEIGSLREIGYPSGIDSRLYCFCIIGHAIADRSELTYIVYFRVSLFIASFRQKFPDARKGFAQFGAGMKF